MKKISLIVFLVLSSLSYIRSEIPVNPPTIKKQTFLYAIKGTDSLLLDCWIDPTITIAEKRPVLMYVFGGGFMGGERWADAYMPYFEHFTEQGFMVVSIDYRLGLKKAKDAGVLNNETFINAFLNTLIIASEDLIDATAFILKNAEEWGIDKNRIIASGSSAGAITCLHTEYEICNQTETSKRLPEGFNYKGMLSFAGAIFSPGHDLKWLQTPCPILFFHGDADDAVPYHVIRENNYGAFGSKYISDQLTELNAPHWFYSVENAAHELAGSPMTENLNELDTFIDKMAFKKQQFIFQTNVKQPDKPEIRKDYTKFYDFMRF